MKKYKTLNNKFCKEIVRLSFEEHEISSFQERKRISAFNMLTNVFHLFEDSVLCRLWLLVGKQLLPFFSRHYLCARTYFKFSDNVLPILSKGGVYIE